MMHINKSGRLLNSKKLSLVLDLDNTLLHCSDHPDSGRCEAQYAVGWCGVALAHTLKRAMFLLVSR